MRKTLNLHEFNRGVFLVNVLGIVYDEKKKKILIGRRENDPYFPKLSWCFPGGRPGYSKDLEFYLKKEIKKKTNLDVKVERIVFAKTYPENHKFLSIYYFCKVVAGKEKAKEKLVEIKWIKPTQVKKYFTTSLHPEVSNF